MKAFLILSLILVIAAGISWWNMDPSSQPNTLVVEQNEGIAQTSLESGETGENNNSTVNLSGSGLTQVPLSVFTQREITELNLSNNNLTGAIQAEIRHLKNLETLNLSNNYFTGVPAEIGQLQSLKILNLSNNQLTGLPHELGNLKNLQSLDLRGNNPSELDLKIIRESLPNTVFLVD